MLIIIASLNHLDERQEFSDWTLYLRENLPFSGSGRLCKIYTLMSGGCANLRRLNDDFFILFGGMQESHRDSKILYYNYMMIILFWWFI